MVDISIVIVNYNTAHPLKNCLTSIYRNSKNLTLEIIVIDNASTDQSISLVEKSFPRVTLIKNKKNLLYSKANNQGLRKASGRYFLVLNPDTVIRNNTLSAMVEFLDQDPSISLASCREIDKEGKTILTCHKTPTPLTEFFELRIFAKFFKNSSLIKEFRYKGWDRETIRDVDTLPGSFLFGRKEVLKKIGYFDEHLPLFYSDTDLCKRAKDKGLKLYHNGTVTITHLCAQSLGQFPMNTILMQSLRDMLYFHKKHYGVFWSRILFLFARFSLLL